MIKIIFFTPYAGRTGSEMFLWYMFRYLDPKKFEIMLVSDGAAELLENMPPNVRIVVTHKFPSKKKRLVFFFERLFGIDPYERQIIKLHNSFKPDYWYLNTVLMADKIVIAKKVNARVVSHIHELMTDYSLVTNSQLKSLIEYSALCIGDSLAVCESLRVLGAKNIKLQYECIDHSLIKADAIKTKGLKEELGLTNFKFIWLMSGTSSIRKGTDMVCKLAEILHQKNMALIWLGNNTQSGMDYYIEKYFETKGLDNVFFLGKKTDDYYSYMSIMDGFVLMSREEPFGMVVTEALALGKPVVAFDAGGVKEILTKNSGIICDSWNIPDLVTAMETVVQKTMGFNENEAKNRALEFDVKNQMENWQKILHDVIQK